MKTDGYVYMALNADKTAAKVGFTVSPYARMAQLQSASAAPLTIEFAVPAHKDVELELHRRFASSRIRLEWFSDVDAIGEAFCELEQEHADRQMSAFLGSDIRPLLTVAEVNAVLG